MRSEPGLVADPPWVSPPQNGASSVAGFGFLRVCSRPSKVSRPKLGETVGAKETAKSQYSVCPATLWHYLSNYAMLQEPHRVIP